MTPSQYLQEIVLPTVRDFRDERRSRRRAYLACIVTYHLKDYLVKAGWPEDHVGQAMRLIGNDGPYDTVHSICNAAKHCGHDRAHNVSFVVGTDYDRPPAIAGAMIAGLSIVGDGTGGREIPFRGGVDIYWAVTTLLKEFQFFFPELAAVDLADL
jgi:hypothetical protein